MREKKRLVQKSIELKIGHGGHNKHQGSFAHLAVVTPPTLNWYEVGKRPKSELALFLVFLQVDRRHGNQRKKNRSDCQGIHRGCMYLYSYRSVVRHVYLFSILQPEAEKMHQHTWSEVTRQGSCPLVFDH